MLILIYRMYGGIEASIANSFCKRNEVSIIDNNDNDDFYCPSNRFLYSPTSNIRSDLMQYLTYVHITG